MSHEKVIALNDIEARLAAQGKLGAILRVIPDVVSWGSEPRYIAVSNMPAGWYSMIYSTDCGLQPHGKPLRCPFPAPGQRLGLKESWRKVKQQCGTGMYGGTVCDLIDYKSTTPALLKTMLVHPCGQDKSNWSTIWWGRYMPDTGWRSPVTMPARFIRHRPTVQDVRAVQVCRMQPEDAIALGFSTKLREHDAVCHLREQVAKHYRLTPETWVWFARLEG